MVLDILNLYYMADLVTGRELQITKGGRAEYSGFCSILTIFGYLNCASRRHATFPFSC